MSLDYAFSATKKDQEKFFTLARNCKFVVMDEAHMAIAPSYKQVLDILGMFGEICIVLLNCVENVWYCVKLCRVFVRCCVVCSFVCKKALYIFVLLKKTKSSLNNSIVRVPYNCSKRILCVCAPGSVAREIGE